MNLRDYFIRAQERLKDTEYRGQTIMSPEDRKNYETIMKNAAQRAPALTFARAMGSIASVEEALFLASIVEDETKKLGLPEYWFSRTTLAAIDEQEAKTLPYKCGKCGKRFPTSDKRNGCSHDT